MYGWGLLGWADEKHITLISDLATPFRSAEVEPDKMDGRPKVDIPTILLGILGL